jgi:hypothetical protein
MTIIIIPIIIAIATGLAILSFRAPLIFNKLFYPFFILYGCTQIIALICIVFLSYIRQQIYPFIAADKLSEANKFFDSINIGGNFYLFSFVALLYFCFLCWLSNEVIKHKGPEKKI